MSNKVSLVKNFIYDHNVDIFGVSETWLNNDIYDATVQIDGYCLARKDSPSGIRKHGVAVYVKNGIKFSEVDIDAPNTICIHLTDKNIFCAIIYRPPSSSIPENQLLIDKLTEFTRDREVCLLGDFNLPSLNWMDDTHNRYIMPTDQKFLDFFADAGLVQMVHEPTNFPSLS